MKVLHFKKRDYRIIDEALYIAEDATANFYKFSTSQWEKRLRYDIRTLLNLKRHQITDRAFALICRDTVRDSSAIPQQARDVYLICLQDHLILNAILKDRNLSILPLLIYILTHELVHVVRFCNFHSQFNAYEEIKEQEERIVDLITFDILKSIMLPKLNYILELYHSGKDK